MYIYNWELDHTLNHTLSHTHLLRTAEEFDEEFSDCREFLLIDFREFDGGEKMTTWFEKTAQSLYKPVI